MSETCDLEPFQYDQVPQEDDATGLQLSQEQLQGWLGRFLDCVCADLTDLANSGPGGGVTTFLGLTDTPASYSGQAGEFVRVNALETALEFATPSAGADSDGLVLDYSTSEQTTNRTYTGGETIYQKTVAFGALPNVATKSVAHGITGDFLVIEHHFWVRRDSDNLNFPVPHQNTTSTAGGIQLSVDGTNVNVVAGTNRSAWEGDITLFYIKL